MPCEAEGWVETLCRIWDNALNTQPLSVRAAWNWSLHVTSSGHRIAAYSMNKSRETTKKRLGQFESAGTPFAPITRPTAFQTQSWYDYLQFWKVNEPRGVDD